MTPLSDQLKSYGRSIGLSRVRITSAEPPHDFPHFLSWLKNGFAGEMEYLAEKTRREKRGNLSAILPGVKSVIVGAVSYKPTDDRVATSGKIARYAWGRDYHEVVLEKLEQLIVWLRREVSTPFESRAYVDTGPILERSLAERAGIGWIGKNTCIMNEVEGSYLFLGEILTTLELQIDSPAVNHCGTCTRCLDACPTEAFVGPFELDARKCISYQTIENRKGEIPSSISNHLNGWVAGCDICQEVCPWNRETPPTTISEFAPGPHVNLDVKEYESLSPTRFDELFGKTSLKRIGWKAFVRNARLALLSKSP